MSRTVLLLLFAYALTSQAIGGPKASTKPEVQRAPATPARLLRLPSEPVVDCYTLQCDAKESEPLTRHVSSYLEKDRNSCCTRQGGVCLLNW
jgi:hypothetical protein